MLLVGRQLREPEEGVEEGRTRGRGGREPQKALGGPRESLSFQAASGPNTLTMMEKTKATMLMGYAGQKQETMVSHR